MRREEERVEVRSPICSMPPIEGRVPQRAGREGAEAAVGVLAGAVRRAAEARSARARPAGAARDARREGADHLDRAARPARCAPAGRGFHDRGQRRCRARARSEEVAGHVPRPRTAKPREAGRAEGLSEDLRRRIRAGAGDQARHLQPDHRADRRCRRPRGDHGAAAAHADAGALWARAARPFRAGARDLRPFHVADPPLCRPAGPSLAGEALTGSATAAFRPATKSGSSRSASRSRCSSGAPWRPSARPSTAMSRPISPTRSGSWSNAASPASSRSASSRRSRISAATGSCSRRISAANISATTRRRKQLVGDETGETYRVGQRLTLRLAEANPVSGSLRFELPEGSYGGAARTSPPGSRARHRAARPAAEHPPSIAPRR